MSLSVNVTASMPPEMVEKIDQARGDQMSRAEYIRYAIRLAEGTPFQTPDGQLPDLSGLDREQAEAGGAA